jgi:hypothetical protein
MISHAYFIILEALGTMQVFKNMSIAHKEFNGALVEFNSVAEIWLLRQ